VSADTYVDEAAPGDTFLDGARDAIKTKGLRYAGVSMFNVVLGQGLLIIFYRLFSASDQALPETTRLVRGGGANTLAVVISAVPAYYLSRAFVWGKRGKSELRREVLPFWILVFIGLVVSTALVGLTAHFLAAPKDASFFAPAKLAANVASIAAFGILWVVRFFWMDNAFHLDQHHAHGPLDVLLDEDEPVEPDAPGR
jgi:putative flippase GtrA